LKTQLNREWNESENSNLILSHFMMDDELLSVQNSSEDARSWYALPDKLGKMKWRISRAIISWRG